MSLSGSACSWSARLAARHGIRVRLQQAEFGGLTALVWLPDEIIIHHGAAAPGRPGGAIAAGPRRGSHEAAVDLGRGTLERSAAMARSAELTSPREDARGAQLGRRLMSDAAACGRSARRRVPGPSRRSARPCRRSGPPVSQVGPPVSQVGPLVSQFRPARVAGRPARVAGRPARDRRAVRPQLADVGPDRYVAARFCSVPRRSASELPRQVPQAARSSCRRPKRGGCPSSTRLRRAGLAAAARRPASPQRPGCRWSSPADEGSRAAETVEAPITGAPTSAGLPKRLPKANLVPGSIPSTQPVVPNRSPAAARDRLAGFQRGASEGRAAASEVADPDGEDQSLTGWHDTSG